MADEQKQEQEEQTEQAAVTEEETDQALAEEETSEQEDNLAEEEAADVETTDENETEPVEVPSFSGDVEGDETFTYDQLQAASEEYTDEEFHELEGMYEGTLNEIEEKEIVTGRVEIGREHV